MIRVKMLKCNMLGSLYAILQDPLYEGEEKFYHFVVDNKPMQSIVKAVSTLRKMGDITRFSMLMHKVIIAWRLDKTTEKLKKRVSAAIFPHLFLFRFCISTVALPFLLRI
ncbi:hypothetical protein Leryth_007565 [Lithospermum erythrorhizon]|nr:hypothetical protein Leryth_007565 [Lithospermum erythrorhizon]